jgi:hypothetical protein
MASGLSNHVSGGFRSLYGPCARNVCETLDESSNNIRFRQGHAPKKNCLPCQCHQWRWPDLEKNREEVIADGTITIADRLETLGVSSFW